jgi:hypothetical protein
VHDISFPPLRESPPVALVVDGAYQLGTYDGPIATVNPLDVAGAPTSLAGRARRTLRNVGLKEWEAFQLGDDDLFVLGAVYNAKVTGLLQILVVDKRKETIQRWERKVLPTGVKVARGLSGTRSYGRTAGFSVSITNELERGVLRVDASHPGGGERPPLELHGTGSCGPDEAGHLVIVHPFDSDRALYSHKTMMPFTGTLDVGVDRVGLDADRGFLILDDHHGDYPRPMRYDWLTAVRRGDDGEVQGFNLTRNQIRDPDRYNENALWIGASVHRLPAITIDRPDGPWGVWHAHDRDGAVDVRFTPTVRSAMHVGPNRSLAEYYAPYGWMEGTIEAEDARLDVDGYFGMGEQKRISV